MYPDNSKWLDPEDDKDEIGICYSCGKDIDPAYDEYEISHGDKVYCEECWETMIDEEE